MSKEATQIKKTEPQGRMQYTEYAGKIVFGEYRPLQYISPKFEKWVQWIDNLLGTPEGELKLLRMFEAYRGVQQQGWDGFQESALRILDEYKTRRVANNFTWSDFNGLYQIYQIEMSDWTLWTLARIFSVEDELARATLTKALENSTSIAEFIALTEKLGDVSRLSAPKRAAFYLEFKRDFYTQLPTVTYQNIGFDPNLLTGMNPDREESKERTENL